MRPLRQTDVGFRSARKPVGARITMLQNSLCANVWGATPCTPFAANGRVKIDVMSLSK